MYIRSGSKNNSIRLVVTLALLCSDVALAAFTQHGQSYRKPSFATHSLGFCQSPNAIARRPTLLQFRKNPETQEPPTATATRSKIVYQKVVRPSGALPHNVFLSSLVEYLKGYFQLPGDLPIAYEALPHSSQEANNCILAWDSPISPSLNASRLELAVVGIINANKDNNYFQEPQSHFVPNAVMVVVRKAAIDPVASPAIPPALEKLMAESENKILQSLEAGLEDFIAGNIPEGMNIHMAVESQEVVIEAEVINEETPSKRRFRRYFNTPDATINSNERSSKNGWQRSTASARASTVDTGAMVTDIQTYIQKQRNNNAEISDFVKGAFAKAYELLNKRNQRRRAMRVQNSVRYHWRSDYVPDPRQEGKQIDEPETPEMALEELRQIFATGENSLDQWVRKLVKESLAMKDDIDTLSSMDGSGFEDLLEEELADLELCIESLYGGEQNVDRPPIVNYSEEERIDAMEQAASLVEVLSTMRTIKNKRDDGRISMQYFYGREKLSLEQVEDFRRIVGEATDMGLIEDPRLQLLVRDLWRQSEDKVRKIAESYTGFLVSKNFVSLAKERVSQMADREMDAVRRGDERIKEAYDREREIIGQLAVHAQVLVKESQVLRAESQARHLEILRRICEVVMDPRHTSEEEIANAVADVADKLRLLWDDAFVTFLMKAINEEEAYLAGSGISDHPDHNHSLLVLLIIKQGIDAEITNRINGYLDHIWQAVRTETTERGELVLKKMIERIPPMDIRLFAVAVDKLYGGQAGSRNGKHGLINPKSPAEIAKFLNFQRYVSELLPPEQVAAKACIAEKIVTREKEKFLDARMAELAL